MIWKLQEKKGVQEEYNQTKQNMDIENEQETRNVRTLEEHKMGRKGETHRKRKRQGD